MDSSDVGKEPMHQALNLSILMLMLIWPAELLVFAQTSEPVTGLVERTPEGTDQAYLAYVPSRARKEAERLWPIVLTLPAWGTAQQYVDTWRGLADSRGFIVAVPHSNAIQGAVLDAILEDLRTHLRGEKESALLVAYSESGPFGCRYAFDHTASIGALVALQAGVPAEPPLKPSRLAVLVIHETQNPYFPFTASRNFADQLQKVGFLVTFEELATSTGGWPTEKNSRIIDWFWELRQSAAKRVLEEASQLVAQGNPGAAMTAVERLAVAEGDADFRKKLEELRKDLRSRADQDFRRAEELWKKGNLEEAVRTLHQLGESYRGSSVSEEVRKILETWENSPFYQAAREKAAKAAQEQVAEGELDKALALLDQGEIENALQALGQVAEKFAGTETAERATQRLREAEHDPELRRRVAESRGEKEAARLFAFADNFQKNGMRSRALETFRKILDQFPGTSWAEKASGKIRELEGHSSK